MTDVYAPSRFKWPRRDVSLLHPRVFVSCDPEFCKLVHSDAWDVIKGNWASKVLPPSHFKCLKFVQIWMYLHLKSVWIHVIFRHLIWDGGSILFVFKTNLGIFAFLLSLSSLGDSIGVRKSCLVGIDA